MNVRDFLLNFVESDTKICVMKQVNGQILFYGKAKTLDHIDVLNKMVEYVECDIKAECLNITVNNRRIGSTSHLSEDFDFVY